MAKNLRTYGIIKWRKVFIFTITYLVMLIIFAIDVIFTKNFPSPSFIFIFIGILYLSLYISNIKYFPERRRANYNLKQFIQDHYNKYHSQNQRDAYLCNNSICDAQTFNIACSLWILINLIFIKILSSFNL